MFRIRFRKGNDPPSTLRPGSIPKELLTTMELLPRLQLGDPAAWEEFHRQYYPILYQRATGRIPGRIHSLTETCDVVNSVIEKFWAQVDGVKYVHKGALGRYLTVMLYCRLAELQKAAYRRIEDPESSASEQVPAPDATPLDELVRQENLEAAEGALKILNPEEQLVILLGAMGRNPFAIARELGRPVGDTTGHFFRRTRAKYREEAIRLMRAREKKGAAPRG